MRLPNDSYEKILENLYDGLYFVDKNRVITFWNKGAERISGFSASEVIGRSCSEHILTHIDSDGCLMCDGNCPLADTIDDGFARETQLYMHHKDGHRIPVSVRVSPLKDQNGAIIGAVEMFSDISGQAANEMRVRELEKMAMLDALTQLANRNFIEKELFSRFEEKRRFQVHFGILFMDIDHFKRFNDTYGHDVGDRVLKTVADSLVSNSRPFDVYGRWGGEEFIGIIRNVFPDELQKMANRVRVVVEQSYLNHGNEILHVTLSIGATMVTDGDTIESLIKRADKLMYESKHSGRNRVTSG